MPIDVEKHKSMSPPQGMDFRIAAGSDGRLLPSNEWHGVKSLDEAIANPVPGQDTHLLK